MRRFIGCCVLALVVFLLPAVADAQKLAAPAASLFLEGKSLLVDEPSKALPYAYKIRELAGKTSDPVQRALALGASDWLIAEINLRTGEDKVGRDHLFRALDDIRNVRGDVNIKGYMLISLGSLYSVDNKAAEALSSFQEAYNIFRAIGEGRGQALSLKNIADLYLSANDNERAQRYYAQASKVYTEDKMLTLSLRNSRGNVLMKMEKYSAADSDYQSAFAIASSMGRPILMAVVLNNMARNQVEARWFSRAEQTLKRGIALTSSQDALELRRMFYATAARLAMDQGDLGRASELIDKAFRGVDIRQTSDEYRTFHLYAYQIYRALGDYRRALAHLEALKRLSDESAKVATTNSAALMAARFDYANQELTIQKLTTEQLRKAAEFQRTLFFAIGGATLVLIALLSFGLVTIRRSRNQVRDANVVLNQTNAALEKALQAKTEFLATTSHEIRTPLNGILGMTQVMLADPRLGADLRDRIGVVHGAGVTMRALVDDILDVAKMETGNMTVELAPMDLPATLTQVTRIWQEQARGKGLDFQLDIADAPGWIVSDAGRLRQVVFNLLSNAIKFTSEGSVGLAVHRAGTAEAPRLELVVHDSGIGIPPDKFEEIFESFRQADSSTTRQFGGTGLGLTICRNLARALGGDIRVASTPGEGAVFTVDLPLIAAEPVVNAALSPVGGGGMLVVDRNPITRSMMRTLFESHVNSLQFAVDTDEAVKILETGDVDRLLIDEATLKSSGADPLEMLRKLCAIAPRAASAVLWQSPDVETQSRLLDAGIGQVIHKPVSGAALVEAILPRSSEKSGVPPADSLVSQAA